MVGPGRLELPTLRLSGVRSNHLSYRPSCGAAQDGDAPHKPTGYHPASQGIPGLAIKSMTSTVMNSGKRNEDGDEPHLLYICRRLNRS